MSDYLICVQKVSSLFPSVCAKSMQYIIPSRLLNIIYCLLQQSRSYFVAFWIIYLVHFPVFFLSLLILGPAVVDQLLKELAQNVTKLEEKFKNLLHGTHVCMQPQE